jgi:hypothetical protein
VNRGRFLRSRVGEVSRVRGFTGRAGGSRGILRSAAEPEAGAMSPDEGGWLAKAGGRAKQGEFLVCHRVPHTIRRNTRARRKQRSAARIRGCRIFSESRRSGTDAISLPVPCLPMIGIFRECVSEAGPGAVTGHFERSGGGGRSGGPEAGQRRATA